MTPPAADTLEKPAVETPPPAKPVAVIDVGSTSIRMAIAEIDHRGSVRRLESLSQAVNLGRDTFTKGAIGKSTIEDCVRVLQSYRQLLQQYGISRDEQIRIVATSAVREATNRLAFLDRIFIATGLKVEAIEEADVNRVTYHMVQPLLKAEPALAQSNTIVTEVGGGSTELLVIQRGEVAYSQTYRLGSLRLREMLQAFRAPRGKTRQIMENQIGRVVDQVVRQVSRESTIEMVALGGDVRFAAYQLLPDWNPAELNRLSVAALEQFADRMLGLSPDELVQQFHLSFPDAESLGPALLTYVNLARGLKLDHVYVTNTNLRDALLQEMAVRGAGTDEFDKQVIRSALDLGRKYGFDEAHARCVADLSRSLFDALVSEHKLDARFRLLLYVSALLHEIGLFVSGKSHHKHSMYLIRNSELFGLGGKDLVLTSMVARYHRRASPKPTHPGYRFLDREDRIAVAKMAAILRVADALERSHSQRVREIQCAIDDDKLVISIPNVDDISLEQLAIRQKGSLFEEVFGKQVLLRQVPQFNTA